MTAVTVTGCVHPTIKKYYLHTFLTQNKVGKNRNTFSLLIIKFIR